MIINWNEDLAVGEMEIDRQHLALIEHMNCLWEALSQGNGSAEITKVIGFLNDYVVFHFSYEEKQMANLHYPGMALHLEKHRQLTQKIEELKEKLNNEGPNQRLAVLTLNIIFRWFVSHIKHMDKDLADLFNESAKAKDTLAG